MVAVTRSLADYETVVGRGDRSAAWGFGLPSGTRISCQLVRARWLSWTVVIRVVVGEVGLDGGARVSLNRQQVVFDDVIRAITSTSRIVSVPSYQPPGPWLRPSLSTGRPASCCTGGSATRPRRKRPWSSAPISR